MFNLQTLPDSSSLISATSKEETKYGHHEQSIWRVPARACGWYLNALRAASGTHEILGKHLDPDRRCDLFDRSKTLGPPFPVTQALLG